ncbi:MAG TPA: hypothetical protein VEB20_03205 [Azospirillaceae bacterium]|nr:hypothetical protein [Azospirillaceae bacterium]
MSTGSLSGIGGSVPSLFQTGSVRAAQQPPVEAVRPVERDSQRQQAEGQEANTAPTEQQRQEALSAGRTRGSFVNITA